METGEKATSHGKAPSRESDAKGMEESPPLVKSHRSGDKKKKMKKVVYYETDSSLPSTSGSDVASVTSQRHERKRFSKISLRYPRISKRTPLLSVPLGKPPYFDGEDYCMWSDKMRHHLTSIHASIWDIIEFGAQVPTGGDKGYDSDEVAQIQHFNSQATTILLASICQEEYNKVQGLKSAKEIWDVLKTTHEGDEVTKITKRETIEGELGRFVLHQGEEPQAMYNRLKTLVNQVRNLRSTKWDDHELVKVTLRSLVFCNSTQVQLISGDPRYKLMSPEEVIGKFVSFELMIKGSKHIVDLEQGGTSTPEVQPIAFKATEEKKEEATSSRLPIDASKLDNVEMAFVIKSFRQILKQRRGKDYKPRAKRVCYKCGKPGHFSLNAPCLVIVTGTTTRGERRRKRRSTTRGKAAMPTCVVNGTPTRVPPTPPTRMLPTSPTTRVFSSPTSTTSASWQRTAKRRRYKLEPPPSILHLVTRVVLVKMKMTCLLFLPTLTCNKRKN
jgi:hypothetical protein